MHLDCARTTKKRPPFHSNRRSFSLFDVQRNYFLWRCRFRSLRCLCLRIFLRRFLTTLPTISPLCLPEFGAFPFSVCFSSTWTNGQLHPRDPGGKAKRLFHPTKALFVRRLKARVQPRTPSSPTLRPEERVGVVSLRDQVNPGQSPAGWTSCDALPGAICRAKKRFRDTSKRTRRYVYLVGLGERKKMRR